MTENIVQIETLHNVLNLPFIQMNQKNLLPDLAGCYLVIKNKAVLYIGATKNLNARWRNHERLKFFLPINPKIHYCLYPEALVFTLEGELIQSLSPLLNGKQNKLDLRNLGFDTQDQNLKELLHYAFKKQNFVNARSIQSGSAYFKSIKASQIREFFVMAESYNYGVTQGSGNSLEFRLS